VRIEELMNRDLLTVDATEDQEEAARDFERYDLVEVGVVDENKRLVGVLTVDDIVDVIHEEATEDIKLPGRRRRRRNVRQRLQRGAQPRPLAGRQPAYGDARIVGHQPVRRHDRADGGAGRADAHRRVDGRQCRHPDDDGHRAGAGDTRPRPPPGAAG
jgi:hypothetical protein